MSKIIPDTPADASAATLTEIENRELLHHEHVIKSGLETFNEVGNALMAIRDARLYRATHKSFEDYCRERWNIQRAHAYRLIEAAAVVHNLSPIGDTPKSESVARPLTKLPPADQPKAWAKAQEIAVTANRPATAKIVEQAVAEIGGKWVPGSSAITKLPAESAPEDSDSDALFHLKRWWKKAAKKDKKKFLGWVEFSGGTR